MSSALVRLASVLEERQKRAESLAHAVGEARRDGHTWKAVGTVLGITRQAAAKRFRKAI